MSKTPPALRRYLLGLMLLMSLTGTALANKPAAVSERLPALARAGKPVLSIATPQGPKTFTLQELEALGLYRVHTSTFWPDDDGTYTGPRLIDVLKQAGLADTKQIRISARDGFSQVLPQEDWLRWPVILATRRDDKGLGTRDKGPLRVIYPRDSDARLQDSVYRLRWVWMVNKIEVAK